MSVTAFIAAWLLLDQLQALESMLRACTGLGCSERLRREITEKRDAYAARAAWWMAWVR